MLWLLDLGTNLQLSLKLQISPPDFETYLLTANTVWNMYRVATKIRWSSNQCPKITNKFAIYKLLYLAILRNPRYKIMIVLKIRFVKSPILTIFEYSRNVTT